MMLVRGADGEIGIMATFGAPIAPKAVSVVKGRLCLSYGSVSKESERVLKRNICPLVADICHTSRLVLNS